MYMLEYIERFIRNPKKSLLKNENVILYSNRDWLEPTAIKVIKAYQDY